MTQCTQSSFGFHRHHRRRVEAGFDGGRITTEGGALLLREVERRTGIVRQFAGCFRDHRDPDQVEFSVHELVAQRVFALAQGYEDLNDHEQLRHDPMLALLVGRRDLEGRDRVRERDRGRPLAGKSTLNRLELRPATASLEERYKRIEVQGEAVESLFVELFVQAHPTPPERVVLDFDCTDDPIHGHQEGRFFHGYYNNYCYLPLYVFAGEHLLCARLRTSNLDGAEGSLEVLQAIVARLRQAWPEVAIVVRADSGFARDRLMTWCEQNGVDYILGLARNPRLTRAIGRELHRARREHELTDKAVRIFRDLRYRTQKTWSRSRRVVAKAEHIQGKANPRFVVTSLSAQEVDARTLYEQEYCARGDMENRIKEQQLGLFADRTSAATMRANQLRLWFSSVAYLLLEALRRLGLQGTELARTQCTTLRSKLLKIGAQVHISARRVYLSLAGGYPYAGVFAAAHRALRGDPALLGAGAVM